MQQWCGVVVAALLLWCGCSCSCACSWRLVVQLFFFLCTYTARLNVVQRPDSIGCWCRVLVQYVLHNCIIRWWVVLCQMMPLLLLLVWCGGADGADVCLFAVSCRGGESAAWLDLSEAAAERT